MNRYFRACWVGGLLASHQPAPGRSEPVAAAAPRRSALLPARPQSAPVEATRPAPPPYVGYHRYRGTVGGRPVTVELTIAKAGDSLVCTGSYAYGQHSPGQLQLRAPHPYRTPQPLALTETNGRPQQRVTGRWQAAQAAGPLLSGTWRSPAGRQLPFVLREDYTDGRGHLMAVRYELVGEEAKAPCRPERREGETRAEYRTRVAGYDHGYSRQFLHLLGPDTLRPSLLALQCPEPAERRRQVRAAAREEDGCNFHTTSLQVDYNAYGLLAWNETWEEDFATGARPAHGMDATVYDLRGGQVLTLADAFRPGTDTLLRRLITQSVLRGHNPDLDPMLGLAVPAHADDLAPLSTSFTLAEEGMAFGYEIDSLLRFTEGGAMLCWVQVPWAELQPLLRPTSPVARMLRERGLWRTAR